MSNIIHPTAVVGPNVKMGKDNFIGPYAVVVGNTILGDKNSISAFSVIGTAAEKRGYFDSVEGHVWIGSHNRIREYVTINAGTFQPTKVGDRCIFLRGSHVGHDVEIGNDVTLSCNALIGGESFLFDGVNFGLGAVCHQRSIIGAYSIIGMNSTVLKRSMVAPFTKYAGSPVKNVGENSIALESARLSQDQRDFFINCFIQKHQEKNNHSI